MFTFKIPSPVGETEITLEGGSTAILVGANGTGKTRLAAHIETAQGLKAHRIAAHRALVLNTSVPKIKEQDALSNLLVGTTGGQLHNRAGSRWGNKAATTLLNDFGSLIQALFADQANKSLDTHKKARSRDFGLPSPTKFERLVEIWERLLPHRQLRISGDDIEVAIRGSTTRYDASEMSDGERAVFYMIGQTLVAVENSLLIFDEPELHVHRSIMAKVWDELEAARQDCGFVFITHDLEFAASRVAQKFVIREYDPAPAWTIERVPDDSGFDEEITTLILGSRRPILFVEGKEGSLDAIIYRCCFPGWTVIPRGSCEEVIHSVVTMRRNSSLTRLTCKGIVDADAHEAEDISYLKNLGVAVLPVSEIENLILLPAVSRTIAESDGYEGQDTEKRLAALKAEIFATLDSSFEIDAVVERYVRRRIDRHLKKIDLSAARIGQIVSEYDRQTKSLDIQSIAESAGSRIRQSIIDRDLPSLLAIYDNKGMMALAARHLKNLQLHNFQSWLTRVLRNGKVPALIAAILDHMPPIEAN